MTKYKLLRNNDNGNKQIDELFLSKGHNLSLSSGSITMTTEMLKIWKENLEKKASKMNK